MGMDVYGKSGNYFRANIWVWHPLWTFVEDAHPELAAKVKHGHTNDGDGLKGKDSRCLAQLLRADVQSGMAEHYVSERDLALAKLPDDRCYLCMGTGVRTDAVGEQMGMHEKQWHSNNGETRTGWCNGCEGKGKVRPFETSYYLTVADITRFADFLAECDGFKIW